MRQGQPPSLAINHDFRCWARLPSFASRLGVPLLLLALCVSLFFREIEHRALWASHEARAAQNAQRMLDDGDWLLPRLFDGQVELQKPPGYYWLVAGWGRLLGGVDGWAVRLPAALAGTGLVLLVWWHCARRGQRVAGLLAACMLAGACHFTGTARIGRIDVPLAFAVAGCVVVARDALPWWRVGVLGFGGAVALLLKGPLGLLLPVAVLGVWWLSEGTFRRHALRGLIALLVALALATPWYLWANRATEGQFFRTFFLYHHLNRAFGGAEALAAHPWWYYGPRLAVDFMPWTPLLLLVRRSWFASTEVRFGVIWCGVMVVGLSLSRFKRADYLLPAYAGLALALGSGLNQWRLTKTLPTQRRLAWAFGIVVSLLPVTWCVVDRTVTDREEAQRDTRLFAVTIRQWAPPPSPVVLFRVEAHLLTFHLGRPVETLVEWHDLAATTATYVVIRAEQLAEFETHVRRPWSIIAESQGTCPRLERPLIFLKLG